MKKVIVAISLGLCAITSQANDLNELTKQVHVHFGKSVCNKVVDIHGARNGSTNILECDTKIYTGNPEYFRITNDQRFPFIRCSALGSWESYSAKKCRGHAR